MIKLLIFSGLCLCVLVQGQAPPNGGIPSGLPPPPKMPSAQGNPVEHHSIVARQAGGQGGSPPGHNGGQGNLGMQGLGNIPDPTVWIAKGQEVASQAARGRRHAPNEQPPPPSPKGGPKQS